MRPRLRARSVVALAIASSLTVSGGVVACIDLFHSTDFETLCDEDASAPGCRDAAIGPDRKSHDGAPGGDVRDVRVRDGQAPPHDAGADAADARREGAAEEAGTDAHEASVDANFCNLNAAQADFFAEQACLWLGACEGIAGQNEFATCYALALLAYDCKANPNQQVRAGRVHDYWQKLSTATTCADVTQAIFGSATAPTCSGSSGCVGDVAISCSGDQIVGAQYCAAQGYGCSAGNCVVVNGLTCPDAASNCTGNVAHQCAMIATGPADIGKDCTNFGGGTCVRTDAGTSGCLPKDPGDACAPSLTPQCLDAGNQTFAIGCRTGVAERVDCTELGGPTGNLFVSCPSLPAPDLASVCFVAVPPMGSCPGDGGVFEEAVSESQSLNMTCKAFGLGHCAPVAGGGASCTPPQ